MNADEQPAGVRVHAGPKGARRGGAMLLELRRDVRCGRVRAARAGASTAARGRCQLGIKRGLRRHGICKQRWVLGKHTCFTIHVRLAAPRRLSVAFVFPVLSRPGPPLSQAGYTAEARYALDGDESTYWSSTGGEVSAHLRSLHK